MPWNADDVFDLLRGVAAYTGNGLVGALAGTIARHPDAALSNAFNHKQVQCKIWLRDALHDVLGPAHGRIWLLGGWYAVLAAVLFDDRRLTIGAIVSVDVDPACAKVALDLNGRQADAGRFRAVTADMYHLDYLAGGAAPDLVINTSCEHIADVRGWLDLLPPGMPVVLQSNDYFAVPEHVSAMPSLDAFEQQCALREVLYRGALPLRKYNRFMLIGRR